MATKIDIISSALLLLGDKSTITLGADASAHVKSAEILYDGYYKSILGERLWRFALKTYVMPLATNQPKIGVWRYVYQLPADILLISHVQPLEDYEIFGNYLYTNVANTDSNNPPTLIYTHHVTENNLPPYFTSYLIERMAALFAMKVTNDPSIAQFWAQTSELKKRDAVALDYQSQTSQLLPSNEVVSAHFGLGLRIGYNS